MARVDGAAKVAGVTRYTADVELPGMCWAAVVRSPYAHARIERVDGERALEMAGVLRTVTAEDLPDRTYGRLVKDVRVLARGEVRFIGERVAAVVAESRTAAERAALRVAVDYHPLTAVTEIVEALAEGAPPVHAEPWCYPGTQTFPGSHPNLQWEQYRETSPGVEEIWQASDFRIDRSYRLSAVHQGYLEPQACVGFWDAEGRAHLWLPNKSPYRLREQLGAYFDRNPGDFVVHPVAIGGDFGGKGSPMDAPLCLELSRLVGRPVKLVLRYSEDLSAANPRHDGQIRIRLGCDGQGRLTAMMLEADFNGGAYAGFKPDGQVKSPFSAGNSYRIGAHAIRVRRVYTHTVPRGNMRAPGAPQTIFAFESAMDELARAAGMDPTAFRRRNLVTAPDEPGARLAAIELRGIETLDAAVAAFEPEPVAEGWKSGVGWAVYPRATHGGRTSVRIVRNPDQTLTISVPIPETGTGSHTAVRALFAEALGVEPEQIRIEQLDTDELPTDDGVGGSRVTAGMSAAAAEAAQRFSHIADGPIEFISNPVHEPSVVSFCVEAAQVAVDPQTGQIQVVQLFSAVDVAEVINPLAHQIQIEGGMAMGFGFACLEDLAIREGQVTAANLGDYKMPSARDIPRFQVVLVPGGRGVGAGNVKAIGELTNVPTAAAIANAIEDAVGVRLRCLPLASEDLFWALKGTG